MGGNAALQLVHDAGLNGLVHRGSAHAFGELGSQRMLPVLAELRPLLPGGGLRRGTTVGIESARASGAGATSLLLALLVEASRAGSWCAVVGLPALGVVAAQESGVELERLALVPYPGPDWPTVVAALLDGFDIVVTAGISAAGGAVSSALAGRLAARARQRGGVLVPYRSWPSTDLTLEARDPVWHGVEAGRGRLRGRQLTVVARGRGAATAPRLTHLWLPRPSEEFGAIASGGPPELASVHPLRPIQATA
jgi:hypothetical protein